MNTQVKRMRLDQALAKRGLAPSRSRARDMIARKCVQVDGRIATKAGACVDQAAQLLVDDPAQKYVSRAALKLDAALGHAGIDVQGKCALDLGSSTGGFTQVLLERGAKHIWAVDVGHGQMVPSLSQDARVSLMESTNARNLTDDLFERKPEIVVSDMSFVSLILAAEPALLLASENALAVLLVKPQFEVGKDGIGKGGIVTDQALIENALKRIQNWFNKLPGWHMTHLLPSPILGGDGNTEHLLCGVRSGDRT